MSNKRPPQPPGLRWNKTVIFTILAFTLDVAGPLPVAQGQEFVLPAPGTMVALSPAYNPPLLKGLKVHPDNPFRFDFILDQGDSALPTRGHVPLSRDVSPGSSSRTLAVARTLPTKSTAESESVPGKSPNDLKQEANKLIKYFLASLTIPEKDLWVNLSPYEKNRIIPDAFGKTEMGRDLLAEDYMLKQITSSLIYPEGETGKKFWKKIYAEAAKRFGTTNIPVNTFNKVWIVPEKAVVYENAKAGTAYVVESKLKVMLEEDYLSQAKHGDVGALQNGDCPVNTVSQGTVPILRGSNIHMLGSQIIREIVIPELTKEVNTGANFAQLRQVYNSLILATWYKKKIKDSILTVVYANQNKIQGITSVTPGAAGVIYQRYLQAFKKGTYNFIKEETDPVTRQPVPRKYFSGGVQLADMAIISVVTRLLSGILNREPTYEADVELIPDHEPGALEPLIPVSTQSRAFSDMWGYLNKFHHYWYPEFSSMRKRIDAGTLKSPHEEFRHLRQDGSVSFDRDPQKRGTRIMADPQTAGKINFIDIDEGYGVRSTLVNGLTVVQGSYEHTSCTGYMIKGRNRKNKEILIQGHFIHHSNIKRSEMLLELVNALRTLTKPLRAFQVVLIPYTKMEWTDPQKIQSLLGPQTRSVSILHRDAVLAAFSSFESIGVYLYPLMRAQVMEYDVPALNQNNFHVYPWPNLKTGVDELALSDRAMQVEDHPWYWENQLLPAFAMKNDVQGALDFMAPIFRHMIYPPYFYEWGQSSGAYAHFFIQDENVLKRLGRWFRTQWRERGMPGYANQYLARMATFYVPDADFKDVTRRQAKLIETDPSEPILEQMTAQWQSVFSLPHIKFFKPHADPTNAFLDMDYVIQSARFCLTNLLQWKRRAELDEHPAKDPQYQGEIKFTYRDLMRWQLVVLLEPIIQNYILSDFNNRYISQETTHLEGFKRWPFGWRDAVLSNFHRVVNNIGIRDALGDIHPASDQEIDEELSKAFATDWEAIGLRNPIGFMMYNDDFGYGQRPDVLGMHVAPPYKPFVMDRMFAAAAAMDPNDPKDISHQYFRRPRDENIYESAGYSSYLLYTELAPVAERFHGFVGVLNHRFGSEWARDDLRALELKTDTAMDKYVDAQLLAMARNVGTDDPQERNSRMLEILTRQLGDRQKAWAVIEKWLKNEAMNTPAANGRKDITWAQLQEQGYTYTLRFLKGFAPVNVEIQLFHNGILQSKDIYFEIFPGQNLVHIEWFMPDFPRPVSEEDKMGRGRALLRALFEDRRLNVFGYRLFCNALDPFIDSLQKMPEIEIQGTRTFVFDFERVDELTDRERQRLNNIVNEANVWGKIPDITWEDLKKDGYSVNKIQDEHHGSAIDRRFYLYQTIGGRKQLNSQDILLSIFPDHKIVYIRLFHPEFGQDENAPIGRGRALLRALFRSEQLQGYHVLAQVSDSFKSSLQEMPELFPEFSDQPTLYENIQSRFRNFGDAILSDWPDSDWRGKNLMERAIYGSNFWGTIPGDFAMPAQDGVMDAHEEGPEDIPQMIRTRREEKRLTQEGLAHLVGMSRFEISRYEHGSRGLSLKAACQLDIVLGFQGRLLGAVFFRMPHRTLRSTTQGEDIKIQRFARDWTRNKLAQESGVSLFFIIRAEGDQDVDPNILNSIYSAFERKKQVLHEYGPATPSTPEVEEVADKQNPAMLGQDSNLHLMVSYPQGLNMSKQTAQDLTQALTMATARTNKDDLLGRCWHASLTMTMLINRRMPYAHASMLYTENLPEGNISLAIKNHWVTYVNVHGLSMAIDLTAKAFTVGQYDALVIINTSKQGLLKWMGRFYGSELDHDDRIQVQDVTWHTKHETYEAILRVRMGQVLEIKVNGQEVYLPDYVLKNINITYKSGKNSRSQKGLLTDFLVQGEHVLFRFLRDRPGKLMEEKPFVINVNDIKSIKAIPDRAQTVSSQAHQGGIDLTSVKVGASGGIQFSIDPAQLAEFRNAEGFVPVITRFKLLTDVRRFLTV